MRSDFSVKNFIFIKFFILPKVVTTPSHQSINYFQRTSKKMSNYNDQLNIRGNTYQLAPRIPSRRHNQNHADFSKEVRIMNTYKTLRSVDESEVWTNLVLRQKHFSFSSLIQVEKYSHAFIFLKIEIFYD